ncbi:putative serine/threonine-protein kinase pim-3-like [Triplophysa rosa]|uniref:non-specific serine/threonine protein kinase n=1 Tax=Triplophysa rosa TaxID=992332 RepID=A0A9W7WLJ4_TRIRA|nr:putative serine/threonine-protein kinase pim-3-like [Triplophysa rosa]
MSGFAKKCERGAQKRKNLRDKQQRRQELLNKIPKVTIKFLSKFEYDSHLVVAVQNCIEHGVFDTDIHPANILINTNTLDLKLIDFSCGQLFTAAGYQKNDYRGAPSYCPPEILSKPRFHAIPANVWHLGLILYEMVNGSLPCTDSAEILFENPYVSKECRSVVKMCLAHDQAKRPMLEQIVQHRWFSGTRSLRCEFSLS